MKKDFRTLLKNPLLIIPSLGHRGFFNWMSDETYLRMIYRINMGKSLKLNNPHTFNEKLQWLKLYDRRHEYTMMVDKNAVKDYVASIIGSDYIIPSLGVWDKFDDINFEKLPSQFVLKCTHDSGGLVIVKDKSRLDIDAARAKINHCLKHNYYWGLREWPYKNVKPRIIAERYIEPDSNVKDLPDYKWYCFNGEPKYCQVIQDRSTKETIDFFDTEWNHQDFIGLNPKAIHATHIPPRPELLNTQIKIAQELSKNFPYVRVDLYNAGGKIYFGELTFFPGSGFGEFRPEEWNDKLGSWIKLPIKK